MPGKADKMHSKVKQKSASTANDSTALSINERILKECHDLYADKECGLIRIAEDLGLTLLAPRKKITILLIGNHSAGKSSFTNWYVEEHIQKTGVAIETQGFTFVTSGRKRESLTGNATLVLYPHFEPLKKIEGVVDYLTTEISTSKQKKFNLVTFVDTPGLVDGDMKYQFDVNKSILWLGDLSDLIFVFFDPIGQALCKRTLNLVEKLNEKHPDRMRFYLSKADEAGHESDRQRVMMQIVQELCKRPGLNKTGFDMPTIYIPSLKGNNSRCVNQIDDVCKDIEKTINQTIQNTLNTLEKDCNAIAELIDKKLEKDRLDSLYNLKASLKGCGLTVCASLLPILLLINFLATSASYQFVRNMLGRDLHSMITIYLGPVTKVWSFVPSEYQLYVIMGIFCLFGFMVLLAKCFTGRRKTLNRRQKKLLMENKLYVADYVKKKKTKLYEEYLKQSVAEHDL
ncbi:DgyrCDS9315 [Dimorphilus gyrociliatus]|uniref:DgyrCDS9315 n=1 Tax=Dimorphilus gyrociliatus TaxID=2664684 RepID=A0A7I8VXY1_9ANNE|nr:DgyrCDS9315 [Dimorphilus gyrociliatus]